ncbi:MAG: hypothetical protein ABR987_09360 [Terracidiphilus sp.]
MLDQISNRPKTRSNYVLRGLTLNFTASLIMSIGEAIYTGHLSDEQARVALKERVVVGVVIEVSRGRGDPVHYSFVYEGKSYQGQDSGSYLGLSIGGNAKVYLDPDAPTTNGLRSFSFKSGLNHHLMIFALCASVGSAIASAILWRVFTKSKRREGSQACP